MKLMRKLLCLLLALSTLVALVVPALATEVPEETEVIEEMMSAEAGENVHEHEVEADPEVSGEIEEVAAEETAVTNEAEEGRLDENADGPAEHIHADMNKGASGENHTCAGAEPVLGASGEADTYADYPTILLNTTESNLTIPYGEEGVLKFWIMPEYKNEWYTVEIYDSNGDKVASASSSYYNTSTLIRTLNIDVDTYDLDMTPGKYTVKYWLEYYSYGSWHYCPYYYTRELVVVENKCHGNHKYQQTDVWTEPTCEKVGKGEFTCSVCGNIIYQELPMADHTWDEGVVIVEPTADGYGEREYTCTVCGETQTGQIPPLETAPEKPYKIANVVSGVHVYWTGAEGVTKYGLWRSETGKNGEYKWIANPTVPHFTDTKVESGKTYFYKVTYLNTDYNVHTNKSEAIGVTFVSTPDITSRFNKAAGITLGWEKIEGATGYAIYRKSYSGNDAWVRVGTIEGNSTFTWQDTSVKNSNGTVYKYTIRALAGADMKTLSGCRNAGRTMARLTSRTLNSALKNGTNGVKCNWNTSSAVTGYEVRFMVGDVVYTTYTVGNYKTGTKTFSGLPTGQTYKIQVRSYLKIDGMGFYSAWSTAKNVTL